MTYRRAALIGLAITAAGMLIFLVSENPRTTFERYAGWSLPAEAEHIRVAVRVGPAGDYVFSTFKLGEDGFEGFMKEHRDLHGDPAAGGLESILAPSNTAPEWWIPSLDRKGLNVLVCPGPGNLRRLLYLGEEIIVFDSETSVVHVSVPFHGDSEGPWSRLRLYRWLAQLRDLMGL